jgi:putative transposase
MDEGHLLAAARYVSLNPVRAHLVARVEDWPWSSMRAHITGKDHGLAAVRPLLDRVPDFAALVTVPDGRRRRLRSPPSGAPKADE